MRLFVIHRFKDRKLVKKQLKQIEGKLSFKLKFSFLDSYGNDSWRQKALNEIDKAEAVIVFNKSDCNNSKNANWEIEIARSGRKKIFYVDETDDHKILIQKLISLYNFEDEFDKCFSSNSNDFFNLYKIMNESSESLIQRRQRTNSFFITAIGSLFTVAIILTKEDIIEIHSLQTQFCLIFTMLLCHPWHNLIDNYGKLNKAKFDVLLRLEKEFGAQIYYAEWIALGKGTRPEKYKSFTTTEKYIPIFICFLMLLAIILILLTKLF